MAWEAPICKRKSKSLYPNVKSWIILVHTQSILLRLMFSTHCCSGRSTAAPGDSTLQLLLSTILLQGSRQVLLATPLLLQVSTMLLMFSTLLILVCNPVMVPTWLLLFLTMLPDYCRCRCSFASTWKILKKILLVPHLKKVIKYNKLFMLSAHSWYLLTK